MIVFFSQISYGQATDTSVIKPGYYRHEIGYIIPFGVLYRYHFKRSAIRFTFNYKNSIPDLTYGPTIRTKLGYQYSFVNKKIRLFTGLDFFYVYSRDEYPHYPKPSSADRYTNMSVGFSPFLGGCYQIRKRLSLGLEVASGFFYKWYTDVYDNYFTETHYYQSAFLYIISVNISYHF